MDRVVTGVAGLDRMLDGGIPEGSSVLVTGTCGTGKSIISLQYLYNGALNGEPGLYVTFEESRDKIVSHSAVFGWDIPALEEKGLLEIYTVETNDIDDVLAKVKEKVEKSGTRRVVLDSLTTMMEHGVIFRSQISRDMSRISQTSEMTFPGEGHDVTRKDVYYIVREITKLGTTALLISEVAEKSNYLSRDTISEFACDGVILLEINTVGGSPERLISVKKMRGTPIDLRMSIMEFGKSGITVEG